MTNQNKIKRLRPKGKLLFTTLLPVLLFLTFSNGVFAQKNIALTAVFSAQGAGAPGCQGSCTAFNNGTSSGCGTQDVWINTNGLAPSTVIGVDFIQWDWTSQKRFNKIIIHHADQTARFLSGGLIQAWDGTNWVTKASFTNLTPACSTTLKFNTITGTRCRITKFEMTGPGQQSNPNFREIEVIEAPGGMNNAGVARLTSPANFCSGSQTLQVEVENAGVNKINKVNINWSKDGVLQTMIPYTTPIDTQGSSGGNTALITLGTHTFTSSTVLNLKVWTSDPNGIKDTMPLNDTLYVTVRPSLSGSYTIDKNGSGNSNFKSFKEVCDALSAYGVCGPVYIKVANGVYTEQAALTSVTGTSATNTITFDGQDSSKCILTYNGSGSGVTLQLKSTSYVTFKKMTIKTTGIGPGYGVLLTAKSDYNNFFSCVVTAPLSTTSTVVAFQITSGTFSGTGDNGNYNTIDNCKIDGGYATLAICGTNTVTWCLGNKVTNTSITNGYQYCLFMYYQKNNLVKHCVITPNGNATTTYNYNYYGEGSVFDGNKVRYNYMGIYNYGTNNSTISNNWFIGPDYTGGYGYGIYIYGNSNKMYHNTIYYYAPYISTTTYAGIYIGSGVTNDIRNNIFYKNSPYQQMIYSAASTCISSMDYNTYYNAGGGNYMFIGGNVPTFTALQAQFPAWNKNSNEKSPPFVSVNPGYEDLHMKSATAVPYGAYLGIDYDMDGKPRCKTFPTIGADESLFGKTKTAVKFFPPAIIYKNAYTTIGNIAKQGEAKVHAWYLNGVKISDSVTLFTNLLKNPSETLKLVTISCSGKDSYELVIHTTAPTAKPVVSFLVDKNSITQGQTVHLVDLSSNGPTTWKWEISPDSTYNQGVKVPRMTYMYGTSNTFVSPTIRFDYPGKYRVCLTASNGLGAGTKVCKSDYIWVNPIYGMNDITIIGDSTGLLYDDGGPYNNYSNAYKKGVLIAPCAAKVYLVFNTFDLECGNDVIKIYDGTDNKGIPLHACATGLTGGLSSKGCANFCPALTTDTFVANSGKMYIEMVTNNSINYSGFEAKWWTLPKAIAKPKANFIVSDSVCTNFVINFKDATVGENLTYEWDLDGDLGTIESTSKNPIWPFFSTGKSKITLIASNCGGKDTMVKTITVYDPTKPKSTFVADNLNPTTNEYVYFTNSVTQCIDDYKWSFKKKYGVTAIAYMNGTTDRSPNPVVLFNDTGCYAATLKVTNAAGTDSMVRSCYIVVKNPYCIPSVSTMVQDIGISYVEFNGIKNNSAQGISDYQNYVGSLSTTVEIGVTYQLTVKRKTNSNKMIRTVWIDWNEDGDFEDAGEKVAEELGATTLSWTTDITPPTFAKVGATVMRIGVNIDGQPNLVCGQNLYGQYQDYRVYVRTDKTPPIITMNGNDTIRLEQGNKFTDPGATAIDNLDGDLTPALITKITPKFNNVIVGTYIYTYNVSDAAGNKAPEKKRVVIVTPDKTPPVMNVQKPDTIMLAVFTPLTIPKVNSAIDLVDGDVSGAVIITNNVDVNKLGTYTILYTVTDVNLNKATVTRYVVVFDSVKPVLTLIGNDPLYHEVNTTFTDPGYTLTDNYYSLAELNAKMITQSDVNENKIGTYTVTYTLTDPSGNGPVSVSRKVIVVKTTKPKILLIGKPSVTIDVNTQYDDPGATYGDDYYFIPGYTTSGTFYTEFPTGFANKTGDYTITYEVIDGSGNTANVTRDVHVVDRIAPTLALKGAQFVNVCRWDKYTDAGVIATDNYDSASTLTPTMEGTFIANQANLEGIYSLRYKATDKSGNVGYSDWRTILVRDPKECKFGTGINDKDLSQSVSVYPNPTQGEFYVASIFSGTGKIVVTVNNVLGQQVANVSANAMIGQVMNLDLRSQPAGVYTVTITSGNQTMVKKIVITE